MVSNHQKLGRSKGGPFSRAFRESTALPTPSFQISISPHCERIFLLFAGFVMLCYSSPRKLAQHLNLTIPVSVISN